MPAYMLFVARGGTQRPRTGRCPMTALLRPDDVIIERLETLELLHKPMQYSEAWRGGQWKGIDAHLALIVTKDKIRWLGRAIKSRRVSTVDYLINIGEVNHIDG